MPGQAKHTAVISLGVMGAGFLATLPYGGAWTGSLLHGGFEAGLVGGLADWFAVTALFRHPLGIPIPHTALLPRNRDKVVQSLISAMENELLTKESIIRKAGEFRIGEKALALLEEHIPDAAQAVVRLCDYAAEHLPSERIAPFVKHQLDQIVRSVDSAALLRKLSDEVLARGLEEKALLFLLDKAEGLASRPETRDQLGYMAAAALGNLQAGGFMGFAVNAFVGFMSESKLGGMLQDAILTLVRDMRQDEEHPLRQLLAQEMRNTIANLPNEPAVISELALWKEKLLTDVATEARLCDWIRELQRKAVSWVRDERFADEWVRPAISGLVAHFKSNPAIIDSLHQWLQNQLVRIVEANHWKIGKLVKENIDKLDNASLIRMMEEKVGKDLQWIRVNGAVCGFLIGLVLEGLNLWF